MDKLDTAILLELMKNSRVAVTALSKKVRVSREVANYRIDKLKKEGVIIDFVTEIDIEKLGYVGVAIFVSVKAKRETEFEEFLKSNRNVSWVAILSGLWSFGFSVIAKNQEELDKKFFEIYQRFKDDIIDHRFVLHKKSYFFYEKYFSGITKNNSNKYESSYRIDSLDKMILKDLSKDSRVDYVELSKRLKLTAPAIKDRIKKLELNGFIKKYSLFVDISKLNLLQYSIFIINKNINDRKKLISYLSNHTNVSFIAEYIGDPFIEFGLIVKDPYDLRNKLREIEESFPDNRLIEISLFQKEFISVGPPPCIFD